MPQANASLPARRIRRAAKIPGSLSAVQLRARLERAGLTQVDFSAIIGVSISAVSRWTSLESRSRGMPPRYATAVLTAYELLSEDARMEMRHRLNRLMPKDTVPSRPRRT